MSPRVIMGMSLIALSILAVFATTSLARSGERFGRPLAVIPPSMSWTTERWTGDDRPYEAIRANIDALVAGNKLTRALIDQYGREAAPKYTDPQAVFRLDYAIFQAQQAHPPIHLPYSISGDMFYFASSPHTYNYDRLRFLASAKAADGPELVAMGRRLLLRDPRDRDVRYWLVRCYRPGLSEKEKKEAINQAQDFLHMYPGAPVAYATLGYVYFSAWMVKRNPADGQKALAAYKEYLRLGPLDDERRAQIESTIHLIEGNPPN